MIDLDVNQLVIEAKRWLAREEAAARTYQAAHGLQPPPSYAAFLVRNLTEQLEQYQPPVDGQSIDHDPVADTIRRRRGRPRKQPVVAESEDDHNPL